MASEELRTWLGLRRVDLLIYLAGAALIALFSIDNLAVERVFCAVALLLLLAACPLGMWPSTKVSWFTNGAKMLAYPSALAVGFLLIGLRYVAHYQIPQNGMYPGLPAGSHFLAIKRPYRDPAAVARGDIVSFAHPDKGVRYLYIWRVVGLPGDAVVTKGEAVILNGRPLDREKVRTVVTGPSELVLDGRARGKAEGRPEDEMVIYRETNGEAVYEVAYATKRPAHASPDASLTVPDGQFFVMGDNRYHAVDSRSFGPITIESIVAKKW